MSNFALLPSQYGNFLIKSYPREENLWVDLALWKEPLNLVEPSYVRIHSECLTGDVFGSLRCDCGQQIHHALSIISRFGGLLIYLRQEGRGIGLHNKIEAYKLQDQGLDTVEANLQLGFAADERNYDRAIEILNDFNLKEINLLTNNPAKIKALESNHFIVHPIPIISDINQYNLEYLKTKKEKLNHLI